MVQFSTIAVEFKATDLLWLTKCLTLVSTPLAVIFDKHACSTDTGELNQRTSNVVKYNMYLSMFICVLFLSHTRG